MQKIIAVVKDVEKLEFMYIAGRNVPATMENSLVVSQNDKLRITI